MNNQYYDKVRACTYDETLEAAAELEGSDPSDERSMKIYLLRHLCGIYRLLIKASLVTDRKLMEDFDVFTFFGSNDPGENWTKIKLLENRLAALWKSDAKARAQNGMAKFNIRRMQKLYAETE